ncbi:MAG: DUF378 domain-containing protein [Clostridia bacterium]|nr:DUF378 domain-containing protein [Clostridia bacterium]
MKIATIISFILVIIGALNWFMIGVFAIDVVALIFGSMGVVSRIIYALVGVAGLWVTFYTFTYRPFSHMAA